MIPLLKTKLYIPPIRADSVARLLLLDRLSEGLRSGRKLTLISAPAGFGKTTCASAWINTLDEPATWLSLDPADDDPSRFFAYFLAALQKIEPGLGQEIAGVLRSGQLPPFEAISAALINDMVALEDRFLLVLDDVQVIQDRFILQVLESLVNNLPPQCHLVLLTREDPPLPLARLRANNELTEIRARDLRFSRADVDSFLNQVMGLSLSPADVAALDEKTEGWIAGLQLAAIALQSSPSAIGRDDPSGFIADLSGSHRLILSYLTEQVLDRQTEEVRQFLLQTAILDRMTGDLCDAVRFGDAETPTGRLDSRDLLGQLFNANLFLVPLDDAGQWYRYHHLFSDLLRNLAAALPKEDVIERHRRASRWYAQAGMMSEAIQHALTAEDYKAAVDLLEDHAADMIMQGYVKTVNGWVEALPEEWDSRSPRTNLALAWMHLLRGAYTQAIPYLERADVALTERHLGEDTSALKAEWLVMRSLMLNMDGEVAESQALAEQALAIAPARDDRVLSLVHFGRASVFQSLGATDQVMDAYQMAIQYGRSAGNLVTEMMSTSGLAHLAFEHGQLHLAFEIAAPVADRAEQTGSLLPINTAVFGMLGEVLYQWHRIEQARYNAQRALHLSKLGGYRSGMIGFRVLLSRLSQLKGDMEAAFREVQSAFDLMAVDTPSYVRQEAISQQVRLALAQNRPNAAEMALQGEGFSFRDPISFPDISSDESIPYSTGLLYNSGLRVLLHQARSRRDLTGLRSGIAFASQLIENAFHGQYLPIALEGLLLRAQMHVLLGDRQASQADLIRALELAEPEGFIGVFVEQGAPVAESLADLVKRKQLGTAQRGYVERILAAFQRPGALQDEQPAALVEPLTDRELDVLRLIAQGLKYKEIAERLVISLNTVRYHVKAIYGKLSVNNRTQAVETARDLQLL